MSNNNEKRRLTDAEIDEFVSWLDGQKKIANMILVDAWRISQEAIGDTFAIDDDRLDAWLKERDPKKYEKIKKEHVEDDGWCSTVASAVQYAGAGSDDDIPASKIIGKYLADPANADEKRKAALRFIYDAQSTLHVVDLEKLKKLAQEDVDETDEDEWYPDGEDDDTDDWEDDSYLE